MLLLIFRASDSAYAFDAGRVIEVVPRVGLRAIPHAPEELAGLLAYRGIVVPVIDFCVLIGESSCGSRLSTRIILADVTPGRGEKRLLGVIADDVSHVVHAETENVVSPAMNLEEAPYLAEVFRVEEGLVQLIRVDKLMSERLQTAIYGPSPPG